MKSLELSQSVQSVLNAIFVKRESYYQRAGEIAAGKVGIYSHIGSHKVQEDSLYFCECLAKNKLIFAAADGLGRYNGGAQAAEVCIEALHETLTKFDGDFDPHTLARYIRLKMRKDPVIMYDSVYAGGACMVIACVDLNSSQVKFYSMGDTAGYVESHYGEIVFEIEADKKTTGSSGVTKALTPQLPGLDFKKSETYQLSPGDKIHCMTDGVDIEKIIHDSTTDFIDVMSNYFSLMENAKNLNLLNQDNSSIISFQLNKSKY